MLNIRLTNTMSRKKEEFQPVAPGKVGLYVCGPTVYGPAHMGHARTALSYDVIVNFFEYAGYEVNYISNITDVGHLTDDADDGEDKVEKEAKRRRIDPIALATDYMNEYFEDMAALGIRRPTVTPRATEHIPEMIALVEKLIERGYAYEVDGTVYYDISRFDQYGDLARRNREELLAGARVVVDTAKRHPADFALWFRSPPEHILKWESPWGLGYPGWHIECSAMSMKYIGETLDIHGGAIELSFPHHENEIAQSEGATGKPFVNYWVHGGLVQIEGQKMAKSLGNFVTVRQLLEKCRPEAFRLVCLGTGYRSPLDYTESALKTAEDHLDRLNATLVKLRQYPAADRGGETFLDRLASSRQTFEAAMQDDFNTAIAVAELLGLTREVNSLLAGAEPIGAQVKDAILAHYGIFRDVLGVPKAALEEPVESFQDDIPQDILDLVAQRQAARKAKDFAESDRIRDLLLEKGYTVKDTPEGPECRKV